MLSQLNVDSDLNLARLYMFIMGAAMGTLMPLYSLLMQNSLPFRLLGAGTATNQFFRQMGAAMGISLFGAMIVSGFSSQLTKAFRLASNNSKSDRGPAESGCPQGFRAQLEQQSPGSADSVIQTAREALAVPVTDVFLYGAIVMAIVARHRGGVAQSQVPDAGRDDGQRTGDGRGNRPPRFAGTSSPRCSRACLFRRRVNRQADCRQERNQALQWWIQNRLWQAQLATMAARRPDS